MTRRDPWLDDRELIEAACTETELSEFRGNSFREGLEILSRALVDEAQLSTAGRATTRARLLGLLTNRLRIEQWYRRHPEIEDERISAPTFVIGLPRTGTTALATLLAQDPDTRSLRSWESAQPTPPPEAATQHADPRIAATQAGIDAMYQAHPEWRAMYDASATGSAECHDLLGMEFRTQHFCGSYYVPSYDAWQRGCDMEPAYRYQARVLALLQWRCPPTRWSLHAPVHLLSLEALDRVYPDARFIWTHRDPAEVLGSVCSLVSVSRSWSSDRRDPAALGREQVGLWTEALERAMRFRARVGEARFADVHFGDLVADPVATAERAYARLGTPFSPAARKSMSEWAVAHPRGRHGEHRYRLEDFGLEETGVRTSFGSYTARFVVATAEATGATPPGWPGGVRSAALRPAPDDDALASGASWDRLIEELRRAAELVRDPRVPATALDRAEGYRHLGVLLKIGLAEMLVDWDPERPRFQWSDGTIKWGLDCSDALYAQAPVRAGAVYRVRGRRESVHFLGFQLVGELQALSDRDADTLDLEPDGSFEVVIGGEPRDGNWMALPDEATTLTVRQFFYDWDTESPAPLVIDRIDDGERREPPRVSPGGIASQLPALGGFVRAGTEFWAKSALTQRERKNCFPEDHGIGDASLASQSYQAFGIGYFALEDDEALIVEVTPPRAKYWSLHLGNFWMESLDYVNHQSSLNGHQAVLDAHGVFRAVITRRDPGVPNWLDTAGHAEGSMLYRWNQADSNPTPGTRLVKLHDVRSLLPPDTARVEPGERRAAIERRRQHMRRRLDRGL